MAAKKKTKKKQTKPKSTANKKAAKKLSKKAGKKPAAKRAGAKKRAVPKAVRKKSSKKAKAPVRKVRTADNTVETPAFLREKSRARMAGQSGDLQGLSDVEAADSESVDELLEEGNAFEADIVRGVQEAGDEDGREVHTHEVPEDDVPEEYLDED